MNETINSGADAVTAKIASLSDWRAVVLQQVRSLILSVDKEVEEDIKWRKPSNPTGVPVWSKAGMICTGEVYKDKVKLTFAYGAKFEDEHQLFNTGFAGNTRRAIDIKQQDTINEAHFCTLIRAAIRYNAAR
ncbi:MULTISPECIES: DUF1801 domain-containing protein [Pseudoalteromonas]|jgi:hypothetical protein|uniref:YdhG-like domain-containing protein n=1 Tax=Pseudoalteromonas piscicida TaxID=43662 RepID=A0A2A5JVI1_PSEO7|nr:MULTISPECIES: DUF1801 domain-containing protein [Pseudoalteromonas]MBR8842747.1 DUF1801 domain-containing protein [Pseudoalteromonas sp. JC3]MCF2827611.1 DUF1801 domain-containing protein [Pseudoalteromonas sp. OF5H-5]MCF2830165.1 DUF1801 domain-containing protein [Pseudoalteromonas sp. DL2-H6]MCF2927343.1 DUF1801 domain-containing protein [Pseudoalteromonas sp. DL2-H1]MCF7515108.1 DUF1801 domain-containing protein [Pseudoalteromonas sp. L7]